MFIGSVASGKIAVKNILLCICHITDCYTPYNKTQKSKYFAIHYITKSGKYNCTCYTVYTRYLYIPYGIHFCKE